MSGPKSTEWSVAENLRLAALARQAAWEEARQLEAEAERERRALDEVLSRTGAAVSAAAPPVARRPAADAGVEAIQRYMTELRAVCSHLRGEAEQAESLCRFKAAVGAALKAAQAAREERAQTNERALAQAAETALKARSEQLQRLLARLPASTSDAERARAETLAQAMLAASSQGLSHGLEMELRSLIQSAQAHGEAKAQEAARAEAMLAKLRGFDDEAVQRLTGRLRSVLDGVGRVDPALEAAVEAARAKAKARADRDYAAQVLREELEALGYAVGAEFTTAFAQGGSILVSRPDQTAHGVELRFDPRASTIASEVVRRRRSGPAHSEALEDVAAESGWCSDLGEVLSKAWERQVQARVVRRQAPGASPVRLTAAAAQEAAAAKARPKAARPAVRRRLKSRQL